MISLLSSNLLAFTASSSLSFNCFQSLSNRHKFDFISTKITWGAKENYLENRKKYRNEQKNRMTTYILRTTSSSFPSVVIITFVILSNKSTWKRKRKLDPIDIILEVIYHMFSLRTIIFYNHFYIKNET